MNFSYALTILGLTFAAGLLASYIDRSRANRRRKKAETYHFKFVSLRETGFEMPPQSPGWQLDKEQLNFLTNYQWQAQDAKGLEILTTLEIQQQGNVLCRLDSINNFVTESPLPSDANGNPGIPMALLREFLNISLANARGQLSARLASTPLEGITYQYHIDNIVREIENGG